MSRFKRSAINKVWSLRTHKYYFINNKKKCLIYNINLFLCRKIWGWYRTRSSAGRTVGRADGRKECGLCSSTRQWNPRCTCKLVCSEKKKTLQWFAFSVGTLQTCKVKISGCFIAFYIFLYRHKLHRAGMRSDAVLDVSNSCLVNLLHKVVSR